MIKRTQEDKIRAEIGKGKTIVIFGARQVGKTTLLKTIFEKSEKVLWLNGDTDSTRNILSVASLEPLEALVRGYKTVIIDEAQRIENIGLKLKILHDNFSDKIQFVATGSSSFDLANKINEPMTGRKRTFWLPQFTVSELVAYNGRFVEKSNLPNRLLYGSYPDVVLSDSESSVRETINELSNDNLYKDILNLGELIKPNYLRKILQALAYRIGDQVSLNELSNLVGLDHKTVDKYISLLEQSFIVFRLPSYSRNLRNELKTSQKIFFYDNGIRNAILGDFNSLDLRPDRGALFENYIISEIKKEHMNDRLYFWRNKNKQEIDLVLEKDGKISALEMKFSPKKSYSFPTSFVETYNPTKTTVVNSENYLDELEQLF